MVARRFPRDCPLTDRDFWGYEIVVGGVSWVHNAHKVLAGDVVLDPGVQAEYVGDLAVVTDGELGKKYPTKGPNGREQVWDGSKAIFHIEGREVEFFSSTLGPCGVMDP